MLIADAGSTFIDVASKGGPIAAILAIILYGGFKENPWWVFGWVYRDLLVRHERLRQEKDAWRDSQLAAVNVALNLTEKEKGSGN